MDELLHELTKGALHGAKALLGWKLVTVSPEGRTAGIIVETEAYDQTDPASHTFKGMTLRNAAMFQKAGTIYVYFTYGMHHCVNIVCGDNESGEAVLIRALQPTEGVDLMIRRRNIFKEMHLTNGPAKLVQALGITAEDNNTILGSGHLHLEKGIIPSEISASPRVGIKKAIDQPWRFYITGNHYVSR